MILKQRLREKREGNLLWCTRYSEVNLRMFGLVAHGEADEQSDPDFHVEMEPGSSLFNLVRLHYELERLLGCPVDVVTDRDLKARIRNRVRREVVPL